MSRTIHQVTTSRQDAARRLSALEDADTYIRASRTAAGVATLGHAAVEVGAASVEVRIDPSGPHAIFCDADGRAIEPGDSWDAWPDVSQAVNLIDPTSPGLRAVVAPGLDFERVEGPCGTSHVAHFSTDVMIRGVEDPDSLVAPERRASALKVHARAMREVAAMAQCDAGALCRYAYASRVRSRLGVEPALGDDHNAGPRYGVGK